MLAQCFGVVTLTPISHLPRAVVIGGAIRIGMGHWRKVLSESGTGKVASWSMWVSVILVTPELSRLRSHIYLMLTVLRSAPLVSVAQCLISAQSALTSASVRPEACAI